MKNRKWLVWIDDGNASHSYEKFVKRSKTARGAALLAVRSDGRFDGSLEELKEEFDLVDVFVDKLGERQDSCEFGSPSNKAVYFCLLDLIGKKG